MICLEILIWGEWGGELEFEEEKKTLEVFIKAEICYRGSSCPA